MKPTKINHIEVPVLDIEQAKSFFGEIFGWVNLFQDFGPEYVLVAGEEANFISFGLMLVDEVAHAGTKGVVLTMEVDDIEDRLQLINNAGGKTIKEKYEISPEIGFAANFEDIFGNLWGLFSPPSK